MRTSLKPTLSVYRKSARWKSGQGLIMTLLLLFSPLLFYRCTDDSNFNLEKSKNSLPIVPRTCSAGSYSIDKGRIVFDDSDEFQQTLDFLSCASAYDIAEWADEIEIETAGKAYREIMDLIYDDGTTDQEFSDYLTEYDGKVLVSQLYEDGVYSHNIQPLFPYLHEIFNLNGEFQIDTSVFKLVGNNFVSICSPTLVPPSSVDEETETDTLLKVFAHPFVVTALQGGCCPVSNVETEIYGSSPRRRLREDYFLVDLTTVLPVFGQFLIRPGIGIDLRGKSQKRRGVIITWWKCHEVDLSFDFELTVDHNYGSFGITSPAEFTFSTSPESECLIKHGDGRFGPAYLGFAEDAPPSLSLCVDYVFEELINTEDSNAPIATFECD